MKRLLKIQSELKAPKGRKNSFGNYNYRSAEDILEAVKPLLADEGLTMVIQDELLQVGERYYIKAIVNVFDAKQVNERPIASTSAYARESESKKGMDVSQITGTASSYARKYALNGMFLIDDTKDADTDEFAKQTKAPSLSSLKAKFDTGLTQKEKEDTLKHYGVEKLADLTDEQKTELENALIKKIKK